MRYPQKSDPQKSGPQKPNPQKSGSRLCSAYFRKSLMNIRVNKNIPVESKTKRRIRKMRRTVKYSTDTSLIYI